TIEWYASELCLSPKYMANLVKQVTGRSAGDCINAHLMAQAKWLLGSSSLSVLEISDQLGFQNQSHFGTFFKRHEGLSPAAFRKKKE
ncbi:MAG: AraC family transcriptional regulator, partial [Paludibacteraceae bacterium]|nr:AraC family transcriptional regulator [Paludibacteraceae bacterium]